MFCGGCGAVVVNGDQFCATCGRVANAIAPPPPARVAATVQTYQPPRRGNEQTTHAHIPPSRRQYTGWVLAAVVAAAAVAVGALIFVNRDDANSRDYPEAVRTNFVGACLTTGGAADYCRCGLEAVEELYTFDQYIVVELDYVRSGVYPPAVVHAFIGCM